MNVQNIPTYRIAPKQRQQLCYYLSLISKENAGEMMTCWERKMARHLSSVVTELELLYLRCYYLDHMTHKMIAQRLKRSTSSVTRGITRGRTRLLKAVNQFNASVQTKKDTSQ